MRFGVATLIFACALSAQAQGSFQNLNFEQAHPVSAGDPSDPSAVTAASALPYWTPLLGGVAQTEVGYNGVSLGAPQVTLVSASNPFGFPAIDGNYSVLLQASFSPTTVSISQTGLIPTSTQSLFFEAQPGNGQLALTVDGQNVPFAAVSSGSDFTLFGANISAWAGQTEQITFSALQDTSTQNNWMVDDISFSTVPEPSPSIVTGVGGLFFVLYRRSSKR